MKCQLCSYNTNDYDIQKYLKRTKTTEVDLMRTHYGYHVIQKDCTGAEVDEFLKLGLG